MKEMACVVCKDDFPVGGLTIPFEPETVAIAALGGPFCAGCYQSLREGVRAQTITAVRWRGIAKLVEECGELLTELGKLEAYPSGKHPDEANGKKPLIERVEDELGDVLGAVEVFIEKNQSALDIDSIWRRRLLKKTRLRGWLLAGVEPDPLEPSPEETAKASVCTATDCPRDGDCPVHGKDRPGQCVTRP